MLNKWNLLYMLINPFNPLVECAFAFGGGGVKPFVQAVFRLFSLSEWELEIVLFRGVNTCHTVLNAISQEQTEQYIYPRHAVLDAVSQEETKQYIYPRHPELDSGSIQLTICNSNMKVRCKIC